MKPKRTISSYILLVGILGLSIVGGIVAYQIYSASIKSQTTPQQITAIKPLDGVINESTINSLKKRTKYFEPEMDTLLQAVPVITEAPEVQAAQEATRSTEAQIQINE